MKLVYIAGARIPTEKAHGFQIMKMCESFSSLEMEGEKLKVELVVPKRANRIQEDPFEYYGIEKIFDVKKMPCADLMLLVSESKISSLFLKTVAFFVRVFTFHFFTFFYILFNKYDILYTRDKFFLFYTFLSKEVVYEAHTFPKKYSFYLPFFKKAKKIIVITENLKEYFMEKGIKKEKILVAPDGVDIEKFDIQCSKFEARERLSLPQDKKIVLYTGHLYEWKGVYILAEASRFLPEDTDVYFIGGTERNIKKFQEQTSDFRIKIMGHYPHSEIPYWLKAADVLVLPNSGKSEISKKWTSPIKMFEYMASNRPIVASSLPSIREVLDEENATLVDPDDAKSLSRGIKKVLQQYDFSDKISNQAFVDVQDFTWGKRGRKIIEFIINT
ncbi:MAG: glycosyltransferase [Candidatus Nealsonbacteria bacterium]|nr:glycosyltransferase [Candidatus Nealsonbacteria bacterium]